MFESDHLIQRINPISDRLKAYKSVYSQCVRKLERDGCILPCTGATRIDLVEIPNIYHSGRYLHIIVHVRNIYMYMSVYDTGSTVIVRTCICTCICMIMCMLTCDEF